MDTGTQAGASPAFLSSGPHDDAARHPPLHREETPQFRWSVRRHRARDAGLLFESLGFSQLYTQLVHLARQLVILYNRCISVSWWVFSDGK